MDTDIIGTVVVYFDRQGIVQVLGGSRIYGEDAFLAQVSSNLEFALRDAK